MVGICQEKCEYVDSAVVDSVDSAVVDSADSVDSVDSQWWTPFCLLLLLVRGLALSKHQFIRG